MPDDTKDLRGAIAATALVATAQALKHEPAGLAQLIELGAPAIALGATGSFARAQIAKLTAWMGRRSQKTDAQIAGILEEVSREGHPARWNVAKLVREALEVVDDRALDALAGLAAEYLEPPGKAPDIFFRGAAEYFSRTTPGETDALLNVATKALAATTEDELSLLAFDRDVVGGGKNDWPECPWHIRVLTKDVSLREPDTLIDEPLATLIVARLKAHHLGRESERAFIGAKPDGVDIERFTLERLAALATPSAG